MQPYILEILVVAAASLATGLLGVFWLRLRKSVDGEAITVIHKQNGRTATLPRDYSPAAVEALLKLMA